MRHPASIPGRTEEQHRTPGPSDVEGAAAAGCATIPVIVRSARLVATHIRQLEFSRPDGLPLPAFEPGAHVDVHLAPGLVRQYSLCGPLEDLSAYTIAVKLEEPSRGGSRAVHEALAEGAALAISSPRNHFRTDPLAPSTVLVAGGIGITPLLCMARQLAGSSRPFHLHYFARSVQHAAFLQELSAPGLGGHCTLHFGEDRGQAAASLRDALAQRPAGAQLCLCGPGAFMELVCATAQQQGWPREAIHLEHFGAGPREAAAGTEAIQVRLARSGLTLHVPPAVTIADALRAAGVPVDTSCEQGVCGTCITRVLAGVPQHHDLFLTQEEKAAGDCMAICVSRASTPQLVLDL